jgi:outer membrane protease
MNRKILSKAYMLFMLMPSVLTAFGALAFGDYLADYKGYSCWAGMGTFTGDVTYQIGGSFVDPSRNINMKIPFPVSKLEFPLNVAVVTIGNEFSIGKNIDIRGELAKNISTRSGKQQDTDFSYISVQPLLAYSSNDSEVQTIMTDIGLRYWVARQDLDNIHIKFGLGAAYLYENLNWRLSNLDQTNYYRFDSLGNIYLNRPPTKSTQKGIIGTYQTTTNMPYLEVVVSEQTDSLSVLLSLGYSPFAQISDEDNHILRQIYSTTDLTGGAYKISAQAKYSLNRNIFLMGKWDWFSFNLAGTETDIVYDGSGDGWTEGHEISSAQSILSFSLGAKF